MKKLGLVAVGFMGILLVSSCLNTDDTPIESMQNVKIDSVRIPNDTMSLYQTQIISTFSQLKDNCEGFSGYDYRTQEGLGRKIFAVKFTTSEACGTQTTSLESKLNFQPQDVGTYTFQFWNGQDSNGGDLWIERKIIVK